jgi:hypothetical protein
VKQFNVKEKKIYVSVPSMEKSTERSLIVCYITTVNFPAISCIPFQSYMLSNAALKPLFTPFSYGLLAQIINHRPSPFLIYYNSYIHKKNINSTHRIDAIN